MDSPIEAMHQVPKHSSKALVEGSYDSTARTYLDWTTSTPSPRKAWLKKLLGNLPTKSRVLELGCGAGVPGTQLLAKHCTDGSVIGVDISTAQLDLACKHVPKAELVKSDMMDLDYGTGTLDAVVGFYSVLHLPIEEQVVLKKRIWDWARDGGWLLVNLGLGDQTEIPNKGWLEDGKGMFWSAWDEEGNVEMVKRLALTLSRKRS